MIYGTKIIMMVVTSSLVAVEVEEEGWVGYFEPQPQPASGTTTFPKAKCRRRLIVPDFPIKIYFHSYPNCFPL